MGSFCEGGKKSKFKHKKLSTTVGRRGGGVAANLPAFSALQAWNEFTSTGG